MRTKLISCAVICLLSFSVASPPGAVAQVNVQVQIAVPTIRFETAPVLVEVTPGVQVVQDYDEEVFFVNGWYWYRSGPTWYQTRDHRGGWVVVQERSVPPSLVRIPRGKYKHYKARGPHPHDQRQDRGPRRGDVQFRQKDRDNDHKGHGNHDDRKQQKGSKHGHR